MKVVVYAEEDLVKLLSNVRDIAYTNADSALSFVDPSDECEDVIVWPVAVLNDGQLNRMLKKSKGCRRP